MGMLIIGVILFFIIGVILSLIGSGGAILTIPVLVYLFNVDSVLATSYSMFIMGISNWVATFDNIKSNTIFYKMGLVFAIPGLFVTYSIRRIVLPIIPDIIFKNSFIIVNKCSGIMLVFAILIFIAAVRTLRNNNISNFNTPIVYNYYKNALQGAGVGIVTGFVGAGGGFLIVPALAFTSKLPMRNAVATSLFIISITTSLGFLGDRNYFTNMNWKFLITCTICSVLGVFTANLIKNRFNNRGLKLLFGYVIFLLGVFVLITELLKLEINF